jgi:TP901 family phage tail tape measure protein
VPFKIKGVIYAVNEDLNVILQAKLDIDKTAKSINIQIDQLEEKCKTLGIDINFDNVAKGFNDTFKKVKETTDKIAGSIERINLGGKFSKGYAELNAKIKEIVNSVGELANVNTSIKTDADNNIKSATITYEEMGKTVKTTMGWITRLDEQQREISTFEELGRVFDDNKVNNFNKNVETTIQKLQLLKENIDVKSDSALWNFTDKLDEKSLIGLKNGIATIKSELSKLSKVKITDNQSLKFVQNGIKKISNDYDSIIKNAQLNKIINDYIVKSKKQESKELDYIKTKENEIYKLEYKISNLKATKGLDTSVYTENITNLRNLLASFSQGNITFESLQSNVKTILADTNLLLAENTKDLDIIAQKEALYSKIANSQNKLTEIETMYSGADTEKIKDASEKLEELRNNIELGNVSINEGKVQYSELANSIGKIDTEAKKASASTSTWAGRLMRTFQFTVFYRGLSLLQNGIKNVIKTVSELDSALVELQKVSNLSGNKLEDFTKQAYQLGSTISKTGKQVIQASTEFARAGFDEKDLLPLAESALKLTSIGDGLTNASEGANTLIAVLRGYNKDISETTHILDVINNVSNNASVSFSDITNALQRMSGVMSASNIDLEKSVSMFTAINEVLRNTEMTSNSLNTLSMRLRGLNEEGESLGTDFVPKLAKAYKQIADIDLTDANKQIKNLYEITSELAPVWDTLSENQKQYLAQESAGIRQAKSFLTLMNNYSRVLEVNALAYNSAGSAEEEFLKWQNSIEGKMNNLKSAIELFSTKTLQSDFVKNVIDATTSIVNFSTAIGGAVPVILSLVTAIGAFKAVNLINNIEKLTGSTLTLATALKGIGSTAIFGWTAGAIMAITAIGFVINKISQRANEAKEAVNALSTELSDLQSKKISVTDLSNQFIQLRQLSKEQELNNEEQQRFIDLQNQIKDILPEVNGHYDKQGNFIISETENIKSLTEAYEELLDAKREELFEASKESYGYNINTYEKEKQKLEDLIRTQELLKISKERNLTDDERFELSKIRDRIRVPFDELEKTIKESRSSINNSLSDIQNDIRNALFSDDAWKGLSDKTQDIVVEELSKVSKKTLPMLSEALYSGKLSFQEFINVLIRLNNESKKTETVVASQKTKFIELQEEFESGKISLSEYTEQLQILNKETAYYQREIDDLARVQEYLGGIIDKVTKNQSLSKDEVQKLVSLYPELENAIYETIDGWSVENDTLNILTTTIGTFKDSYITAQNAISLALKNQSVQRLGITLAELEGIKSVADAYNLIGSKLNSATDIDDARTEQFWQRGIQTKEYSDVFDIGKAKEDIKKMQEDILKGFNPSALGDSIKSSADKALSEIDRLKQELEKRLQDKEFEISLLSFSDSDIQKQIAIYRQMQDEVHTLAQKYRAMGLSENDDYIQQLRTQWMDYAENISQLQSVAFDNSNKSIDRAITQLELQQQLFKDNSKEYLDIEQKKYDEIVKRENLLQQEIARLQAIGTNSAKEQAEQLIDNYYDTVQQRYSIIANLQSTQISIYKEQIELLTKQKDALSNLHKYTMQMIKDEYNAKKKSLQDELKGIEEVFNAKKKALRDEQDARNYQKGLTEKSALVADLENQLAIIKNDKTAIAKRKKLEEELAKAKEDLADYQYEHSIELQEDALDRELEKAKEIYDDKIDAIDKTLSNEVRLREMADKRIQQSGQKLYKQLIDYSKEYGSITEDEIKNAWDNANISLEGYKSTQESVLNKLKEITAELSKIERLNTQDYSNKQGLDTLSYNAKLQQMKSNSAKWNISDETERKRLAEENQKLGKALGLTYDSSTGIWYYDKQKKIRVYHSGGIVGGSGYATKDTEELAKLLKGELVITPPQATKIIDSITNNNSESFAPTFVFQFEGNADSSLLEQFKKEAKTFANIVVEEMSKSRSNTGYKKKLKRA